MTDLLPDEIYLDNRFSLKNKEHRATYELVKFTCSLTGKTVYKKKNCDDRTPNKSAEVDLDALKREVFNVCAKKMSGSDAVTCARDIGLIISYLSSKGRICDENG